MNQTELCGRGQQLRAQSEGAKIILRWPLKEKRIREKMAATAAATGALKIGVLSPVKSEKKPPTNFTRLTVRYPNCFLNTRPKVPAIRALGQEGNSSGGDDDTGISHVCVSF